jgi:hypothetical protein
MLYQSESSSASSNSRNIVRNNNNSGGEYSSQQQETGINKALQHKTPEERRVLELISLLKNSPNKVQLLRAFEDWFFENRPRYSPEYIKLLLAGKAAGIGNELGLVQIMGDITSQVSSLAAAALIVRLLDVENNKDAAAFLEVFFRLDLSILKRMHLAAHIEIHEGSRGNRDFAFNLLELLAQAILAKQCDYSLQQIVQDNGAIAEFNEWSARQHQSLLPYTQQVTESRLKSINLGEIPYKSVISGALTEILTLTKEENSGWSPATLCEEENNAGNSDSEPFSASLLLYKKDLAHDLLQIKLTTLLPYSSDEIFPYLYDFKRRKEWDIMLHKGKKVAILDNETDIVHFVLKSRLNPYKSRDFSCLRSVTSGESQFPSGSRVISLRSVVHGLVPQVKDTVRGALHGTGYILVPLTGQTVTQFSQNSSDSSNNGAISENEGGCMLIQVASIDNDSILLVSCDLLGESNEMQQSFTNLRLLLGKELGKRALNPSANTQQLQNSINSLYREVVKESSSSAQNNLNQTCVNSSVRLASGSNR